MTYIMKYDRVFFFYCFSVLMLVLILVNSLRSQIAWKLSYIFDVSTWMALSYCLVLHWWIRESCAGSGWWCTEIPPLPPKHPKTHSPIHLLALPCFRVVALHFVLLTGSPPFRARLFLPFHSCMQFLSTPVLSIPLLYCGERVKARKAHTGSLECLQAIREMISAVKESLFQGRVNSLFILAFAARQD